MNCTAVYSDSEPDDQRVYGLLINDTELAAWNEEQIAC